MCDVIKNFYNEKLLMPQLYCYGYQKKSDKPDSVASSDLSCLYVAIQVFAALSIYRSK